MLHLIHHDMLCLLSYWGERERAPPVELNVPPVYARSPGGPALRANLKRA